MSTIRNCVPLRLGQVQTPLDLSACNCLSPMALVLEPVGNLHRVLVSRSHRFMHTSAEFRVICLTWRQVCLIQRLNLTMSFPTARREFDEVTLKEQPDRCDPDDASKVWDTLLRYETICQRPGSVLDWHVPVLRGKFYNSKGSALLAAGQLSCCFCLSMTCCLRQ